MIKMESISEKRERISISQYDLIIVLSGFLISRVSILNELTPFGIAYLGAFLVMKRKNFWLALSILSGLFTIHGLGGINYYITVLAIYLAFTKLIKDQGESLIKGAGLVGLSFLFIQFILNIAGQNFKYDLLVLVFESLLVFAMTYVLSYSMPLEKLRLANIKNEQLVCSLVTLALIISGMTNISIYQVSLKSLISISLIIFIAYREGLLLGLGLSVVLGLVSFISEVEMPFIISILVVGGLLAGLFRDLGRLGSILGFILGNGIISFYINNFGTSFFSYRELLVASLGFILLDHFIKIDLGDYLDGKKKVKEKYERQKENYIIKKLDKNMEAFDSISKIFRKTIGEDKRYDQDDVYNLVDQVSNKLCKTCPSYEECWGRNYYESYKNLFNIISLLEIKVDKESILLSGTGDNCLGQADLIEETSKLYGLFKERQFYNNKIMEQRKLLADQIDNLSKIIQDVKEDIRREPIFHSEIEEELIRELKNKRVDVLELLVVEIENNQMEILMEIEASTNSRYEIDKVRKIVSRFLDMDFSIDYSYGRNRENTRSFKLRKTNRFNSFTRTAYESNSEKLISGDNHTFGEMGNRAFMAISDGMGIGKKANEESSVAIELMEKLMETNMDKATIIKTINSILRSKSDDEIFATLDLGLIDLYTGKLQVFKNGSPPTFIKRRNEVKVINSRSLPLGILENVDFSIYEEDLEDGDILIMMSDGVLESNGRVEDLEKWIKDIILNIPSENPQVISDEILSIAKFVGSNKHRDDMTVIASKIWKNI